jgi:predicted Zn-dependent protease
MVLLMNLWVIGKQHTFFAKKRYEIELTGNRQASDSITKPMPRMRNTIVEAGTKSEKELLKRLDK